MSTQLTSARSTLDFARTAVRADGAFCGIGGALAIIGSGPLSSFLGLASPIPLIVVGVLLLPYAGFLILSAGRPTFSRSTILTPAIGNVVWAVATFMILAAGTPPLTADGGLVVGVIAAVAAAFAALQLVVLPRVPK